ncbi:excalibur calcium-binding domain-containing protein [Nocardia sp. NPDC005746]|uniref:excalibur calcium-binding domain-containing protein n=1 Tax=Nocardia sp. NPDC005746 TaxID=3157062 RepID=UPI0033C2C942
MPFVAPAAPPTAVQPPAAPQPPAPAPAPETTNAPSVYYGSCAEAKRAGAAPLRRGDPGYRSGLDRDGDGIACER